MENGLNKNAKRFVSAAASTFGAGALLTKEQVQQVVDQHGVPYPYWLTGRPEHRAARGLYKLPGTPGAPAPAPAQPHQVFTNTVPEPAPALLRQRKLQDDSDVSIPAPFAGFVPFGFYRELKTVIKSGKFFPIFISGMSGNGKTLMVEEACAELRRECIRVNISSETDETHLIGGQTLVDGNVVVRDGPALVAMKRGAILLIDEVDRGSEKLMCLQGIMEGKPYYNKLSGELITPKPGFNVVATANSKGRGSEEGRYLSKILDDAFLERFPITYEQEFPDAKIETKILMSVLPTEPQFVEFLVKWADVVRKTYKDGGIDEVISTRRLVFIGQAYQIYSNKITAIERCVSRFDEDTKLALIDLYKKIDETLSGPKPIDPSGIPYQNPTKEVPF